MEKRHGKVSQSIQNEVERQSRTDLIVPGSLGIKVPIRKHESEDNEGNHRKADDFSKAWISLYCKFVSCSKKFRYNIELGRHYRDDHADEKVRHEGENPIVEEVNATTSREKSNDESKKKGKKKRQEKRISCEYKNCTRKFKTNSQLLRHYRRKVHVLENAKNDDDLHSSTEKGQSSDYENDSKKSNSNSPSTSKDPYYILSSEDEQTSSLFYCEYKGCSSSFKVNFELFKHCRDAHAEAKSYKCETCSKRFARSSHYKEHQNTHKGIYHRNLKTFAFLFR